MPANNPMHARLKKVLFVCAVCLAAGCDYAIFVSVTGLAIPCVFHLLTGLQCAGCGVSRMCLSLLRLDFAGAWQYNPAVLCLLPLGAAVGLDWAVVYIKTGSQKQRPWAHAATIFMIAVLLLFGILRNIPF